MQLLNVSFFQLVWYQNKYWYAVTDICFQLSARSFLSPGSETISNYIIILILVSEVNRGGFQSQLKGIPTPNFEDKSQKKLTFQIFPIKISYQLQSYIKKSGNLVRVLEGSIAKGLGMILRYLFVILSDP